MNHINATDKKDDDEDIFNQLQEMKSKLFSDDDKYETSSLILQNFNTDGSGKIEGAEDFTNSNLDELVEQKSQHNTRGISPSKDLLSINLDELEEQKSQHNSRGISPSEDLLSMNLDELEEQKSQHNTRGINPSEDLLSMNLDELEEQKSQHNTRGISPSEDLLSMNLDEHDGQKKTDYIDKITSFEDFIDINLDKLDAQKKPQCIDKMPLAENPSNNNCAEHKETKPTLTEDVHFNEITPAQQLPANTCSDLDKSPKKNETRKHELEYSFSLLNSKESFDTLTESQINITNNEESEVYLKLIYDLYSELNRRINKLDKSKLLTKLLLESKMGNHFSVTRILEEEFKEIPDLLKNILKTNLLNKITVVEMEINEYKEEQAVFLNELRSIIQNKVNELNKLKAELLIYKKFVSVLNKEEMPEKTFISEYLKENSQINSFALKNQNMQLKKLTSEINCKNASLLKNYEKEFKRNCDLEKEVLKFKSELYKLQVRYKKKTEIIEKQKSVLNVLTEKFKPFGFNKQL
ncbi:hypothetical protein CDIK_2136 [Cucumispora dikerogammari]|nr:hypothetical protein CDIK_2136 [Cucumispora dikerogammari]